MKPTIMIDAGHGGRDSGASYRGRKEKDDTLRLALAVGEELKNDGYPVLFTRTTDLYQKPIEKARMGNESGADYFISIHRNSSENDNKYSGVQTLVYEDEGEVAKIARSINEEMEQVGFRDLGVSVRPDLIVLRRTKMPAVLVEAGFINTDADNQMFDQKFDDIAKGIAKGIENAVMEEIPAYGVQVGLYRRYENAEYMLQQVEEKGYDARIKEWKDFYSVVVGNVESLEDAKVLEKELQSQGYDTLVVAL